MASRTGYDAFGYRRRPRARVPALPSRQRLEIALGAILTQNTAWENARKALRALRDRGLLEPQAIEGVRTGRLASLIRSAGCYNQKARKIKIAAEFLRRGGFLGSQSPPPRDGLLALWGVGEETADCILLYGYGVPSFVVDGYARRILGRLGLIEATAKSLEIKRLVETALPGDPELLGECHALIVRHAKERCRKRPLCSGCPLRRRCAYARSLPGIEDGLS